jgi:hypothetical protein
VTGQITQLDKPAALSGLFAAGDAIGRLLDGLPETGWWALTLDPFGSPDGTCTQWWPT